MPSPLIPASRPGGARRARPASSSRGSGGETSGPGGRVAEGGADRLVDRALHAVFVAECRPGQVAVVHVAGEDGDAGGGTAPLPGSYYGPDEPGEFGERFVERAPVVQVLGAPEPLPPPRRPPSPRARADGLVRCLQVMHAGPEQVQERGTEQQVVEVPGRVLQDPGPLVCVHHGAVSPQDLVLIRRPGLQLGDVQQGVVVALDVEGARAAAEHLDLAGGVRFDPDGGVGCPDVAQQRAEDEIRRHHPRFRPHTQLLRVSRNPRPSQRSPGRMQQEGQSGSGSSPPVSEEVVRTGHTRRFPATCHPPASSAKIEECKPHSEYLAVYSRAARPTLGRTWAR